jgi:iron-sulfur cluster assembly protein
MIVALTPAAAAEMKSVAAQQRLAAGWSVRVGVKMEDHQFRYVLDLTEDAPAADDAQQTSEGVRVLVDPKSQIYLTGTTVDFKSGPDARGFVFTNPNAVKSGDE